MNVTNKYWYLKNLIAGLDKDRIHAFDDSHHTIEVAGFSKKPTTSLNEVIDFFKVREEDLIKDRYYMLFRVNEAAKSEFFDLIEIIKAKVDLDVYAIINPPDANNIFALLIFPSFRIDKELNIVSNKLF